MSEIATKPTDPFVLLEGIKQFGLASDGADLRDLSVALTALKAELERVTKERDEAIRESDAVCDSYVKENQLLHDRATAAEAEVAKLRKALDAGVVEIRNRAASALKGDQS